MINPLETNTTNLLATPSKLPKVSQHIHTIQNNLIAWLAATPLGNKNDVLIMHLLHYLDRINSSLRQLATPNIDDDQKIYYQRTMAFGVQKYNNLVQSLTLFWAPPSFVANQKHKQRIASPPTHTMNDITLSIATVTKQLSNIDLRLDILKIIDNLTQQLMPEADTDDNDEIENFKGSIEGIAKNTAQIDIIIRHWPSLSKIANDALKTLLNSIESQVQTFHKEIHAAITLNKHNAADAIAFTATWNTTLKQVADNLLNTFNEIANDPSDYTSNLQEISDYLNQQLSYLNQQPSHTNTITTENIEAENLTFLLAENSGSSWTL